MQRGIIFIHFLSLRNRYNYTLFIRSVQNHWVIKVAKSSSFIVYISVPYIYRMRICFYFYHRGFLISKLSKLSCFCFVSCNTLSKYFLLRGSNITQTFFIAIWWLFHAQSIMMLSSCTSLTLCILTKYHQ